MSTVEKAFLKSNQDNSKSDINLDIPLNTTVKRDADSLISSQNSISNMRQSEPYSDLELVERRLVYANMQDQKTLNNYRNLRTRLLSLSQKENFVTMVSSIDSETSASLISANLAITFALDEAKTSMLIEGNLQQPSLNKVFDLPDRVGLIDYLSSENLKCEEVLNKTRVPRLGFVPSGNLRENSAEYFTSSKMDSFVKELVGRYPDRFPIINAPSLLDSADARILLELCDLVILVVPYGGCSQDDILKASTLVGAEKLAGLVLNDF